MKMKYGKNMIPLSLLTGYHCSSDSSQGGATVVLSKPG